MGPYRNWQPATGDFARRNADSSRKSRIEDDVRRAANYIIDGKGATYFGIGAALSRFTRCILQNERAVFSVISVMPEIESVQDVALSIPRTIGEGSIYREVSMPPNEEERRLLRRSARVIKDALVRVGF